MYAATTTHELSEPPSSATSLREAPARREALAGEARVAAADATLLAVLEAVPYSAFIVDGTGRVVVANGLGRGELDAGILDLRCCPEREVGSSGLSVHPLPAGAEGEVRTLVLRNDPGVALAARVARAAALWQLTRSQAQVLGRLVEGEANKTIADYRSCAVRTVELHVTCILKKSGARSRTELIAQLWQIR